MAKSRFVETEGNPFETVSEPDDKKSQPELNAQ